MATSNLNTENPNQLEYQNKLIRITVLGGIRIDGLDRMRVTGKIQTGTTRKHRPKSTNQTTHRKRKKRSITIITRNGTIKKDQ